MDRERGRRGEKGGGGHRETQTEVPVYMTKRGRTIRRKKGVLGKSGGNLTSIKIVPWPGCCCSSALRSALSCRPSARSSSNFKSSSRQQYMLS